MKNENAENLENQLSLQNSDEAGESDKTPAKMRKERKNFDGVRLPVLVEITYTASVLLLIVLAITIIVSSFLSGASLFAILLRTSVAIFVMGVLLTLISSQISSGLLFSIMVEQEEYEKAQSERIEKSAGTEDLSKAEAS